MSITKTTLAAAITSADFNQTLRVASATGQAKGNLIRIDNEWFVQSIDSNSSVTLKVIGGQNGSYNQAHASGAAVLMGLPSDFESNPPGTAVPLPVAPAWDMVTYSAAGAIAVPSTMTNQFVSLISGAGSAMTLVDPTSAQEGVELILMAKDAQAYTVTNTTGFNNGSTASDVATFNGTLGSSMQIKAINRIWNVINLTGVTLG